MLKSGANLTEIVDAIPIAVIVHDPNGVMVLVNAQAEALFGYAHGDLLGASVESLISSRSWNGRAEHRDGLVGDPKTGPMAEGGDFRGLHKDGTEFPIKIRSNSVATQDGPVIVSTIVDITERQQTEANLRAGKEQLEVFVTRAPVAMAMFDREMRYIAASRRWSSNYNLGDRDLRGLSHYDVFPDLPDHWRTVHRRGLNGEVIAVRAIALTAPMNRCNGLTGKSSLGTTRRPSAASSSLPRTSPTVSERNHSLAPRSNRRRSAW